MQLKEPGAWQCPSTRCRPEICLTGCCFLQKSEETSTPCVVVRGYYPASWFTGGRGTGEGGAAVWQPWMLANGASRLALGWPLVSCHIRWRTLITQRLQAGTIQPSFSRKTQLYCRFSPWVGGTSGGESILGYLSTMADDDVLFEDVYELCEVIGK